MEGYNRVNETIRQQVVCLGDGQPGRTLTPGQARLWSSERSLDNLNGEVLKDLRRRDQNAEEKGTRNQDDSTH